jgi:AraC-like DNA-binding protein
MTTELLHRNPVDLAPRNPRLLCAGGYGGNTNVAMHEHPCWELIYQRTGRVRTQQGSELIEMCPGMILLHPPCMPHADWATEHYNIFYLYIDLAASPNWPRLRFDDERQSIGQLCENLCHEYFGFHSNRDQMIDLLMQRLALMLDRDANFQASDAQQSVATARRLIDERFRTRLTVDELACAARVSRSTLHANFTRMIGEPPMEYLRNVRLNHALAMLRLTECTLDAIADRCGFYSASHLSRHIKIATGLTPGEVRRMKPD